MLFCVQPKNPTTKRIYESFEPLRLGKLSAKSHLEPAMLPGVRGTCSWAMHTGAKYTKCSRWWSFQSFPKFENKSLGLEKQSWTYFEELVWRILGWKTHPNPNPSEEWKFGWNLTNPPLMPPFFCLRRTLWLLLTWKQQAWVSCKHSEWQSHFELP